MVIIFLRAGSWVDDEHQNDAHDDSDEGRPQVVGDGQNPQTAACLCVHGWEARHQTCGKSRGGVLILLLFFLFFFSVQVRFHNLFQVNLKGTLVQDLFLPHVAELS